MSNRTEKSGPPNRKRGLKLSRAEKIAIPVIIIIAIWVIYSVTQTGPPTPGTTTSASLSTQSGGAPDFTLPVVTGNGPNGKTITLSSFRGKVVLIEFMEPWCPHCQNIAPTLAQLYSKYGDRVVFISVAGPWQGATAVDAANFITKYGAQTSTPTWYYVYDSSGYTMSTSYGVTSTPTFFIIGKDGSVLTSCTQGETCGPTLDTDLAQYAS
jgi:thiol-disulfide isomerase/thioredoxin